MELITDKIGSTTIKKKANDTKKTLKELFEETEKNSEQINQWWSLIKTTNAEKPLQVSENNPTIESNPLSKDQSSHEKQSELINEVDNIEKNNQAFSKEEQKEPCKLLPDEAFHNNSETIIAEVNRNMDKIEEASRLDKEQSLKDGLQKTENNSHSKPNL